MAKPLRHQRWGTALCFALLASYSCAAYTVIDDDLLPTAEVEARRAATPLPGQARTQAEQQERFVVTFARRANALGRHARSILDDVINQAHGGEFQITARPDAQANAHSARYLATARGLAIQQYLLRKGVAPNSIVVTVDSTPNPRQSGNYYPSYITLAHPQLPVRIERVNAQHPDSVAKAEMQETIPQPVPVREQKAQTPISLADKTGKQKSGPATTTQVFDLTEPVHESSATQVSPVLPFRPLLAKASESAIKPPTETNPPLDETTVVHASPAPAESWIVSPADATLRHVLAKWTARANWQLLWEAPVDVPVTVSASFDGDFRTAVKQLFSSLSATEVNLTGLLYTGNRVLRVTETGRRAQ